ncbi:hypothetical protein A0H81_05728 [Grifola frondosa]|uniref:Uncharacterized protein n=1 Tax=Grifola frondosa TaxID=5627 RepID=A0A1C7MDE6_GRIFR|nr:hypothetical protein A0H81_05728 [Grifola frondosa]
MQECVIQNPPTPSLLQSRSKNCRAPSTFHLRFIQIFAKATRKIGLPKRCDQRGPAQIRNAQKSNGDHTYVGKEKPSERNDVPVHLRNMQRTLARKTPCDDEWTWRPYRSRERAFRAVGRAHGRRARGLLDKVQVRK